MGLDDELLEKSPFELSGGQKRRVAIAGVIAMEPEGAGAGRAHGGSGPQGREELLAAFRNTTARAATTVVLVSHSMEEIAGNVDRIVVLSDSHVLYGGHAARGVCPGDELRAGGPGCAPGHAVAMALQRRGLAIDPAVIHRRRAGACAPGAEGGEGVC